MNQIINNVVHAFSNLHVSLPVVAAATLAVLPIWIPQYATQFQLTAAALASYGVIAAANTPSSSQTPPKP